MRHIDAYQIFENASKGLTTEQTLFLNDSVDGGWYYNPETGLVDIEGVFDCSDADLESLRGIRFGRVSGDFNCSTNSLTSLDGVPQEVGGHFDCSENNLTSLKGAPQEVGRNFICSRNDITSLKGAPRRVGENFICSFNPITSLEGAPQEVGGYFGCHYNSLKTLDGAPRKIGGGIAIGGTYEDPLIKMNKGQWNPAGWSRVAREGTPEAQALIRTLPVFKELFDEHPEEMEDLDDLTTLGF